MKSKLLNAHDYRLEPMPESVTVSGVQKAVDTEISHILGKYKMESYPDCVARMDVATVCVISQIPRFNKPSVSVTVGKNFYSRELEDSLIGRYLNESYCLEIQGQTVSVTVLHIIRRVAPRLTDEIVQEAMQAMVGEHPDIRTVAEYLPWLTQEKREYIRDEMLAQIADSLFDAVVEKSQWLIDSEEYDSFCNGYYETMKQGLDQMIPGMTFEAMPLEEYRKYFDDVENVEQLQSWIRKNILLAMKQHLLCCHVLSKEDTSQTLMDLLVTEYWDHLFDYVCENVAVKEVE